MSDTRIYCTVFDPHPVPGVRRLNIRRMMWTGQKWTIVAVTVAPRDPGGEVQRMRRN